MSFEPINNNTKVPISTRPSPKSNATPKSPTDKFSTDKVDTQNADRIKTALASSTTTPQVNSERVTRIQQAIKEGTYTVNADRVAAKILKFEKHMHQGDT